MRRDARSTLIAGAALAAMALASAARADARTINLGLCPGSCVAPPVDDPPAAKNHPAAKITLSRSGVATPTVLAGGLPSPLSSPSAEASRGVTPYDYFGDVADIPLPGGAWAEFAAASFFLFAPSLLDRLSFTDVLSPGDALSGKSAPPPM